MKQTTSNPIPSPTTVAIDRYKIELTPFALEAIANAKEVSGIILRMLDKLNSTFIQMGQGGCREYSPQESLSMLSDILLTKDRISDIAAIDILCDDQPVTTE